MWAVRYETKSLASLVFGEPGLVQYRYWRWRWLARLSARSHRQPMPGLLLVTDARLLGRIRLRAKGQLYT